MNWSLAVTAPNAEHIVSEDLERLSYRHVWFKRRSSAIYRGHVVERTLPAFPRYIFVAAHQCWDVLRDVGKVLGLVSFGENISVVPARVVDQLIDRCGGGDVLPPDAIPEPFHLGDRVVVGGYGPASGHQAIYQRMAENGKLRLEFEWLGRWVPIDVDSRDVSVVTSPPTNHRRKRRRRSRRTRTIAPTVP